MKACVIIALARNLLLACSLGLHRLYRWQVLGLYRLYRREIYICEQNTYQRDIPPHAIGLGFLCLSAFAMYQFPWAMLSDETVPLSSFLRMLALFACLLICLLLGLLIAGVDYKLQLIPHNLLILLALVLLLASTLEPSQNPLWNLVRALLVYMVLRLSFYLLSRFMGYEGIGLGDLNLFSTLALWFDVYSCLWLIMMASLLGLVYIFIHNRYFMHKPPLRVIAFGPWIVCASFLLLQLNVLESL